MATTTEMRTCRTIGHSWDAYDVIKQGRSAFVVSLRCERCTTIRNDIIDTHGTLISRYYSYADGYRDAEISAGTRDDKRKWLMKELFRKDTKHAEVVPIRKGKRAVL